MLRLDLYFLVVTMLLVIVAATTTLIEFNRRPAKQQFSHFVNLCIQITLSATAYWFLIFVLGIVVSAAIWFLLLLLIWVPSEWVANFLESQLFSEALKVLDPAIKRSATSPGITGIPLMDYVSLYIAFISAPIAGMWSIIVKDKPNRLQSSQTGSSPEISEQKATQTQS